MAILLVGVGFGAVAFVGDGDGAGSGSASFVGRFGGASSTSSFADFVSSWLLL